MLTRKQRQLLNYENVKIYEITYKLPIVKNRKLKKVQKRIIECQILIKEGIKYHSYLWGLIRRKQEISQGQIFAEIKFLVRDYTQIIDFLENYTASYQDFLLQFTDNWKNLFTQKYLEIKKINAERNKLEIKNQHNPQIIEKLQREQQENIKSILLLSQTNLLMLEKVKLLSAGIKNLAEDTKIQKQSIQRIVKDLDVYQEIYEYQIKATKIRQEIAKIAETALNLENYLQDYFNPFQSLIDEVVKIDANFYATVGEIQNLANSSLNSQANLLPLADTNTTSEELLDLLVASYEKRERLNDAFLQSQLLDLSVDNFDLINDGMTLDRAIYLISNYMSTQLVDQRKILGIAETDVVSPHSPVVDELGNKKWEDLVREDSPRPLEQTKLVELSNDEIKFKKEIKTSHQIDYSLLQNLLAQSEWQEADIETARLMLQVMGKSYWNEVYQEDILNFSCQAFHTIDQLWKQYSHGCFGFSVQQSIWEEMGGQVDYETDKKLGDRLGWRQQGKWLEYDQLTFNLSPQTPIGHLPVKWLHYDEDIFELYPNSSAEPLSMGAWRVGSWLIWQMHLFFTRAKICNENCS
ncbi:MULTISPECIES: GUN4 domain-containing protein [unclassified Anabaena]|uniref:GUN4 domain-containing protein n=1 Tax=unclassified Anabaena TaxID=2619674 RepID=UPI000830CC94|nr:MULTISPECIES: GUN4 domain-containing protein [unclassified Anabaena]